VATSKLAGYLEYPLEAFDYYSKLGIDRVVCEQKHMSSRAVVIIYRDETVVERRFGITGEGSRSRCASRVANRAASGTIEYGAKVCSSLPSLLLGCRFDRGFPARTFSSYGD